MYSIIIEFIQCFNVSKFQYFYFFKHWKYWNENIEQHWIILNHCAALVESPILWWNITTNNDWKLFILHLHLIGKFLLHTAVMEVLYITKCNAKHFE